MAVAPGAPMRRLPMAALAAAIVALGLFARAFQIGGQVIQDDEWHAIIKLAGSSYGTIATSLGLADFCIPLTLFFKWVAEHGRLSEAWMLGVPFVCGIAAWLYLVWLARRAAAPLALATFALLTAVSPLLVLYSRQARPYAITLAFAVVAIASLYRWSSTRRARDLALYVACGIAAMYFHMIVAPAILGAALVLAIEWWQRDRRDRAYAATLVGAAIAVALAIAALVAPAMWNDRKLLALRTGVDTATPESAWRATMMLLGTGSELVALGMLALAVVGAAVAWKRFPRATRFVAALVVLQVAAVLASGALWLSHQLVLARYLLLVTPVLLLAVALGYGALSDRFLARARPLAWLGAAALVAAGVATGPLPRALAYPNAFFGNYLYFVDFDPAHNVIYPYVTEAPVPRFYRELAALPHGTKTLIEGPWRFESIFDRFGWFQETHRQHVKVAFVGNLCPPGAFAEHPRRFRSKFRNFVDVARPAAELRHEGDYVVFHRKLNVSNVWDKPGLPPVDGCIADFRRRFGAPVFEDDSITVFDLKRGG
jgi:hypothetical protein